MLIGLKEEYENKKDEVIHYVWIILLEGKMKAIERKRREQGIRNNNADLCIW